MFCGKFIMFGQRSRSIYIDWLQVASNPTVEKAFLV
jgi:hypothetical protein